MPKTADYARRSRFAVWLANLALKLASERYRKMVRGAIIYGLKAAAESDKEKL